MTFTVSIVAPPIAPSRSRAIVSVSGSSGTAGQLAPTDIASELLAVDFDPLGNGPTAARGGGDVIGDRGDGEDASAGRHEGAVGAAPSACMEYQDVVDRRREVNDV